MKRLFFNTETLLFLFNLRFLEASEELDKQEKIISRRRISRIMKQLGIVSNYTVAYYKPHKKRSNEAIVANVLNREFRQEKELSVLVSDLTYVRVGKMVLRMLICGPFQSRTRWGKFGYK